MRMISGILQPTAGRGRRSRGAATNCSRCSIWSRGVTNWSKATATGATEAHHRQRIRAPSESDCRRRANGMCDRIGIMQRGELAACGTMAQLRGASGTDDAFEVADGPPPAETPRARRSAARASRTCRAQGVRARQHAVVALLIMLGVLLVVYVANVRYLPLDGNGMTTLPMREVLWAKYWVGALPLLVLALILVGDHRARLFADRVGDGVRHVLSAIRHGECGADSDVVRWTSVHDERDRADWRRGVLHRTAGSTVCRRGSLRVDERSDDDGAAIRVCRDGVHRGIGRGPCPASPLGA